MKRIRPIAAALCAGLMLVAPAFVVCAGNTYTNDIPNVTVTEPDCYSFDIDVTQGSGSSATLSLRVYDVDEEAGELDEVYLNNVYLGYLSGTNDTWSTTTFDVSSHVIYAGANTVRICIDPGGGEETTWIAEIDWGQILVDGGSAEDADILSVDADGTWDAIRVDTLIQAVNADTFRLEVNLLDSTGNNKDIAIDTFSLSAGQTSLRTVYVGLPSEPTATETFAIEANLFNDTTGVQQSLETTTWTYLSNQPPTDITLTDDHIDENQPIGTVIGVLGAVDNDSTFHTFTLIGGDVGAFSIVGDELRTGTVFDYEAASTYDVTIEAEDDGGNTYSESIIITVDDLNDAPVGVPDLYAVDQDEDLIGSPGVLTNDEDQDADSLTAELLVPPRHGRLEWNADGSFTYRPTLRYAGTDSFSYRAYDGQAYSGPADVEIVIRYVNMPPVADAGGPYTGDVGAPILVSAAASYDVDLTDRLQYRWDFDDDWTYDTEWLDTPTLEHVWTEPFHGLITLQVRDLFENQPTGAVVETTAIAEIVSVQTIRALIYDDADGDGVYGAKETVLSGVAILVDGQRLVSGPQGTEPLRLEPGTWSVAVDSSTLLQLNERGYEVEETGRAVVLAEGDEVTVSFAAVKTTTKLKGMVYIDVNEDGERDDGDLAAVGLEVTLDGDRTTTTDARGTFTFLRVPFGRHTLVVGDAADEVEDAERNTIEWEIVLTRTERLILEIKWPYTGEGPRKGFLQVDVDKD